MDEAAWQARVVKYAQKLGWLVAHFPRTNPEGRWRTAVAADAKGYPDLTMVRGSRLIFAELKSDRGRLRPEQRVWLDRLGQAALARYGFEVYEWRPRDWHEVQRLLA